ncbi:mechanosensitive ion channel family protein [Candidatus Woesearchaeota archaeon]|nr:mechanosensitive ion channel family protein [Candidatus Woesearchaeota archaeon]
MEKEENKVVMYVFLFAVLIILRFVGPMQTFFLWTKTTAHVFNSLIAVAFAFVLMSIIDVAVKEETVRKIAHYLVYLGTAAGIFFIIQDELLAASISVGILAAILAFLFQTPLLNLVGWVYLKTGRSFKDGDRIRLGTFKGDVISINPMRTKLLEVGGEYVQADLPSGRLISFPNSQLLSQPIANYSKYFPYIWVDIPFQLTYDTDFGFVMKNIRKIVEKQVNPQLKDMKTKYSVLQHVFDFESEFPGINFNITPIRSWVELRVTFPLNPKEQSNVTTAVTSDIIDFFQKHPKKVAFPEGRKR